MAMKQRVNRVRLGHGLVFLLVVWENAGDMDGGWIGHVLLSVCEFVGFLFGWGGGGGVRLNSSRGRDVVGES
jgi:hypothetical protein